MNNAATLSRLHLAPCVPARSTEVEIKAFAEGLVRPQLGDAFEGTGERPRTSSRSSRSERLCAPSARSRIPSVPQPIAGPIAQPLSLESAKAVAGDAAFGDIAVQLQRISLLDRDRPRRTITILGAGMAGLAAAYELEKLGHRVRIIEGSGRVGGRVRTHRFRDGSHHELGAMRIPASHDYTRHYVREFGLRLRKFVTSHANLRCFYDIHGIQTRIEDAKENLYPKFDLSAADAALSSAPAIAGKYLDDVIQSLTEEEKASLFSTELASERLRELDRMSLGEFLRDRAGPDATMLSALSDGSEPMLERSMSEFLRDELRKTGEGLEEIVGGMDLLPRELARRIQGPIDMRTKVLGVHPREDGKVDLVLSRGKGEPVTETCDDVLCTLPFSILRQVDVSGFSAEKMDAIRNLSYDAATKVLLHCRRRFWESDYGIYGGASHSDGMIRATYYPSDNAEENISEGPGVLVGSYAWGQDARRLGALAPKDRKEAVIREISRFHPEIAEPGMVDEHASMFWEQNPWSAGAYAMTTPGQHGLYKAAIQPQGGVHFAGEHCSLDHGWIQGALISALRAVEEIVTAPALDAQDSFFKSQSAPSLTGRRCAEPAFSALTLS